MHFRTPCEPASKDRQGTKSREVGSCRAARAMGIVCRQHEARCMSASGRAEVSAIGISAGRQSFINGRLVDRWMASRRICHCAIGGSIWLAGRWSADDFAGLDHALHAGALIVLTLLPGYCCPLDRLAASRLLPPRSRLDRSDLVLWPIAAFRGSFGNRVALGTADLDIDASRRRDAGYIRRVGYADAEMRKEATAR